MPKGIFKRTKLHKDISRQNGKKQLGKLPHNAKYKEGIIIEDFQIIKRLTPVGTINNKWLCQCQFCKNEIELTSMQLTCNYKTRCKCQKRHLHSFKGYKDITGVYWYRIQDQAKKRNLSCDITIEYIWELFEKQNHKCALSGLDIQLNPYYVNRRMNKNDPNYIEQTASLDRIDSNLGYQIDNIQWIHKDINIMKRDFDESHFKSLCKLITEHTKDK